MIIIYFATLFQIHTSHVFIEEIGRDFHVRYVAMKTLRPVQCILCFQNNVEDDSQFKRFYSKYSNRRTGFIKLNITPHFQYINQISVYRIFLDKLLH